MRIICLGDSICFGDGVRPDKAWVSLLAAALADLSGCDVRNAGVNGETAADGLGRLPGLLAHQPDILFVQFGLNDAWQDLPLESYLESMRAIVNQSLGQGVRALILALNHGVCVTPEQLLYGGEEFARRVAASNAALREAFALPPERLVLADMEACFADVGGPEAQAALLQEDGVHLSEQGNALYARTLEPVFRDCLSRIR